MVVCSDVERAVRNAGIVITVLAADRVLAPGLIVRAVARILDIGLFNSDGKLVAGIVLDKCDLHRFAARIYSAVDIAESVLAHHIV